MSVEKWNAVPGRTFCHFRASQSHVIHELYVVQKCPWTDFYAVKVVKMLGRAVSSGSDGFIGSNDVGVQILGNGSRFKFQGRSSSTLTQLVLSSGLRSGLEKTAICE